jgi:predicted nucleic acid-binding protein
MRIVVDASVALRWLAGDGSVADQAYARGVLLRFQPGQDEMLVPSLWSIELSNVLARNLRRGDIDENRSTRFIGHIGGLPITVDTRTAEVAFSDTLALAQRNGLTSYDACYLELSLRSACPLATLDKDLRRALAAEGGALFLADAVP